MASFNPFRVLLFLLIAIPHQAQCKLERFMQVDRNIFRGSLPMTHKDYEFLKWFHVKTILSLESLPNHIAIDQDRARIHGFNFISLPMIPIDPLPSKTTLMAAFRVIMDPSNHPIYFHCLMGSDRTGLLAALYRIHVQNWDPKDAYQEMLDYGFKPIFLPFLFQLYKRFEKPGSFQYERD